MIRENITLLRANQIAGITSDFKVVYNKKFFKVREKWSVSEIFRFEDKDKYEDDLYLRTLRK